MRSNTTQRNHWVQLGIGACALVLPPLTLGAAFYSMLTAPDEGTPRPVVAAAEAQAEQAVSLRDTIEPWAVGADPQPGVQATQQVAGRPAPREALVAGSAENPARLSNPVPVQVTAGPSARASPSAPANMERAPTASLGAEPSQSAPAEVSTALLPRLLYPSPQAPPQIQPRRMPATQMPAAQVPLAADLPSAEGAPAPAASKPARPSNLANRGETPAVRRNGQPQRQHAFSLKNWLQQLGILPRNRRS